MPSPPESTVPPVPESVGDWPADRLGARPTGAEAPRRRAGSLLRRLGRCDRAAYRSVARMSTPWLDEPMRRVSDFANFSKPWFLIAGLLALFGGREGKRAALAGLGAVGATSLVVNQPMKMAGERHRPDRDGLGVPEKRWVRMPLSTSFPSGHSASAAAFARAVGGVLPTLRVPLGAAASVVGFSRVYTGVHYPSDVLAGAAVGGLFGRLAAAVALRGRR